MHFIYFIENTYTAQIYVGQTKYAASRFAGHRRLLLDGSHPNYHLQRSWNIHGSDAFTFDVIEGVAIQEESDDAERFYISYLRFLDIRLFNMKEGGSNGCCYSDDSKRKMRMAQLGRKHSDDEKQKISIGMKAFLSSNPRPNRLLSEDHKAKLSAAKRGRKMPQGCIQKGETHQISEDTRNKISEKAKAKYAHLASMTKVCQYCGKPYLPSPHHRHRSKTCSAQCWRLCAVETNRQNKSLITKTCPVCGVVFTPKVKRGNRQVTCGNKECVKIQRAQGRHKARNMSE